MSDCEFVLFDLEVVLEWNNFVNLYTLLRLLCC